ERLKGAYEVVNAGVTAHCVTDETAPDGRQIGLPYIHTEKYAHGIAERGDIYVLLLGTNDAQDGLLDDGSAVDPHNNVFGQREHFIRHYERILGDVRGANPSAHIYVGRPTPILHCIWPKHQQRYLDVILEKLDEIGRRNPDVRMLDIFSAFRARGAAWLASAYQADGLHPGPAGAALIAQLVGDRILADARE
ncbi:MAG: SGNH/GDSL hydrolase family protein, partial [Lachnospiraceae bacterium]|nr:SGNH/GDSL hydrolase family protein [Lachnospiraceae bacterium]